jgi:drug/metabolite transporter (DMT)-like permease
MRALAAASTTSTEPLPERERRRRGELYVALAALVWSTAGVLQRELDSDLLTQLAGRAFFAMLSLFVFVAVAERGAVVPAFRRAGISGLGFAVCLAVASASFITALYYTTVANVLFLQAASPMLAAALAWIFLGERVTRRDIAAMVIALAGVAAIIGGPREVQMAGIGFAVLMTLAFSIAIVISRHRQDVSMAPGACLAQLMVFLATVWFVDTAELDGHELGLLFLIGAFQMGLGLAFLTLGARLLPAAEIALITLLEVVLGPIWVWVFLGESASTPTLVGGGVIIAAVAVQALGRNEPQRVHA